MATVKQAQADVDRLTRKANGLTAKVDKALAALREQRAELAGVVDELAAAEQRHRDLLAAEALLDDVGAGADGGEQVLASRVRGHSGDGRGRLLDAIRELDSDRGAAVTSALEH